MLEGDEDQWWKTTSTCAMNMTVWTLHLSDWLVLYSEPPFDCMGSVYHQMVGWLLAWTGHDLDGSSPSILL